MHAARSLCGQIGVHRTPSITVTQLLSHIQQLKLLSLSLSRARACVLYGRYCNTPTHTPTPTHTHTPTHPHTHTHTHTHTNTHTHTPTHTHSFGAVKGERARGPPRPGGPPGAALRLMPAGAHLHAPPAHCSAPRYLPRR